MLKHFTWFKNLQKQPVPTSRDNKREPIINWQADGGSNNFPQQLLANVYNSPVGSAALDLWQEFVEGGGLVESGDVLVNRTQNLNELNALLSADLVFMWGLSFIQKYSPEGLPTVRYHLPFEETRLGKADDTGEIGKIYHNPYYGIPKDFDIKYSKWYYAFNDDPKAVIEQIKQHNIDYLDKKTGMVDPPYPGQAYWFSIERPLARVYPQPFYYSSVNWFQVDSEIQSFHERNIKNNMLLSVLINMYGDPSAPAGPAEAKLLADNGNLDQSDTVGGVMDKQLKSFINEKGGVLINWFQKEDEKTSFEAFPTNSHHDLFIALQKIVADQIAIGTKVPRVLVGIGEGGKLGDTQEILNAVRMMQGRTRRMREILKKVYEKVFKVPDGTIKNINPVNVIPDQVWGSLTAEEQRAYIEDNFDVELIETKAIEIGQSADVTPEQAAAQAQLKGSVGGVQGILQIQQGFADKLTTFDSAMAILQLIYGFSGAEARRLLGQPEEDVITEQNG